VPKSAASLVFGAVLLAFALWVGLVRADEVRVLVVRAQARDVVAARIRDELQTLGVRVEEASSGAGDLGAIARARGVAAALRVSSTAPRTVELWVDPSRDRGSGAAVTRLEENVYEDGDTASALALRAVELVRGRLLEVEHHAPAASAAPAPSAAPSALPPAEPTPRPPPPPPAEPAPARSDRITSEPKRPPAPGGRHRVALSIGPAVIASPGGGLSASGDVAASVRWTLLGRFAADVTALVPVVPATISSAAGSARISAGLVGLGAWADLIDPERPLTTGLGLGVAAGLLGYAGEASSGGMSARSGLAAFAMPYAKWGLGWRAFPPLTVAGEMLVGVARPRPVVVLEEASRGAFGNPMLAFGLSLQLSIP
jgi:hypothetical protein